MTKRSQPKTDWYSGDQKPMADRVGAYQRYYKGIVHYCWWNGKAFGISANSPDQAWFRRVHGPSLAQSLPWRGIG